MFKKSFVDGYEIFSCQSTDESMVKFKGRNSMKQYIPMKPIKRRYKVLARAEPVTGYLSKFKLYTGRKESNDSTSKYPLGSTVVKKLCATLYITQVNPYSLYLIICSRHLNC